MIETAATRALTAAGIDYEVVDVGRSRSLEEHAAKQGIAPGDLIKTIVVRRAEDDYLFVLLPGDRQIDWPKLRRYLDLSRISLPDAEEALTATGYERGTITPFGSSRPWPVLADTGVAGRGRIAMGSGAHGVSVHVDADEMLAATDAEIVDLAT